MCEVAEVNLLINVTGENWS